MILLPRQGSKGRLRLLTFRTAGFDNLSPDSLDDLRIVPTADLDSSCYVSGVNGPGMYQLIVSLLLDDWGDGNVTYWNRTVPPPKTGKNGSHLASVANLYAPD